MVSRHMPKRAEETHDDSSNEVSIQILPEDSRAFEHLCQYVQ